MAKVHAIRILPNDIGQYGLFFLNDLYHFDPVSHSITYY